MAPEGHLLHKQYDPLDSFTILDGHGPIPKNQLGITPILVYQATIYPQGRMKGIVLKGIDSNQTILELPIEKVKTSEAKFPVIIGKRLAESAKLNKGDEVQIRWRDKNGTDPIIIANFFIYRWVLFLKVICNCFAYWLSIGLHIIISLCNHFLVMLLS